MSPFIDDTDTDKEGSGGNTMVYHLQYSALNTRVIQKEYPQCDKTHMAHTGVCDKALYIGLAQSKIPAENN